MYKMTLTWMNESREWIFRSLSTWPVLFNGGGLFRWRVRDISVAYFFISCHEYLFLFLFYRTVVSWLSYSVSVWSLGHHVWRFSPAIAHLSSFWGFGNLQNHPVSLKIYASLVIANRKSVRLFRPAELIQTPILTAAELSSKGEKGSFRSNCLQNTL